jgi:hypothetical protein
MFGLFGNKLKKLEKKHKAVLEEAYILSKTDRKASDQKYAEAKEIEDEIVKLQNEK